MEKSPNPLRKVFRFILQCCWPPDPTNALYNQATDAFKNYQSSNLPQDLQFALDNFESALFARRAAGAEHPQLAVTLINYATALWARYKTTGRPDADLRQVIALNEEARTIWDQTSPRPNGYPILLTNLGNAYLEAYCRDRTSEVFQKAISAYRTVREGETFGAQIRNVALARMGITLWTRCDLEKTSIRLDEGIDNLEEALRIASESPMNDNILKALCLASLANAYDVRFQRFKQPEDLTNAIRYGYSARQSPQASRVEREATLYNLSRLLWERYQVGRDRADLNDAETIAKEAQGVVENGELTAKIDGVLQAIQAEIQSS